MIIKKLLVFFVAIACSIICNAQSPFLVIERESGDKIEIELNNYPKLFFEGGNLTIGWKDNEIIIPFSSISNFKYTNFSGADITSPNIDIPVITKTGLYVPNTSNIEVFQPNGTRLFSSSKFQGDLQFSIFPTGILIISIDSHNFKIFNNITK